MGTQLVNFLGEHMAYLGAAKLDHRPVPFRNQTAKVDDHNSVAMQIGLSESREYVNLSMQWVRVATRDGRVYTLAPNPGASGRGFLICERISYDRATTSIDTSGLSFSNTEVGASRRLSMLKELRGAFALTDSGTVTHELQPADFDENGGVLYLTDLDVVVTNRREIRPVHPYSEEGRRYNAVGENNLVAPDLASIVLCIVDNHQRIGPKFANLGGDVYRVPSIVDLNKEDGLYVIRNGISKSSMSASPPEVDHFTFAEMDEKFKLFNSVEEAQVNGDVARALEAERAARAEELKIVELKHKEALRQLDIEAVERKHSLERENAELKQKWELRTREYEEITRRYDQESRQRAAIEEKYQHELSLKQLERKDRYEERSYERKDNLEFIKFLPVAIAAILGLVLAFKK